MSWLPTSRRRQYTEDIAAYTRVLKTDPNNPASSRTPSPCSGMHGRTAEAVDEFRQSLRPQQRTRHLRTTNNLGIVLSMLRRYPEAMHECMKRPSKSIRRMPKRTTTSVRCCM